MEDLARIEAFCRRLEEATAERVEPWDFGHALYNDAYPLRWDSNFVRVEAGLAGMDPGELARECDRLLARYEHRNLVVTIEDEGDRLAPGFAGLGWEIDHLVYMVHRAEPDRVPDAPASEVPFEEAEPVIFRSTLAGHEGMPEETARMLVRFSEEQAPVLGTRFFLARAEGEPASYCELYVHDRVAQIESVNTLPEHRGRGLARAVVWEAIRAARGAGVELVFLVADENDWPKHLYRKLGFEVVGRFWGFVLPPEGQRHR